ncbi:GNAT family N-acetyltransferase/peptidase C39 family protein [bacterium]|nr:GNAT family N-acetyltransferase/peptidase C39 family protein [bacterium]
MSSDTPIRLATIDDLPALVALEERSFKSDRFTESQIEYLLTRAHATVLVIEYEGRVVGGAIMLWRRSLSLGRLYNIAIDPTIQGKGLGKTLLAACEEEAVFRRCDSVSLEVRADNEQAIGFYLKYGYETVEELDDYYEDGSTGLKMVKDLNRSVEESLRLKVPYYGQTLEFSCGSACLMMAFKYFSPDLNLTRRLEVNLWKEATLVFMTEGIGGTGPFGIAVAAQRRGYQSRVILSKDQTPFFSSVRLEEKRQIIKLVHEDMKLRARELGIAVSYYDFPSEEIFASMRRGMIPIVLISTYRLHGDRSPHWVVLTGFDSKYVYFHDSYVKFYGKDVDLARNVRIPLEDFRRMRRYGKDLYKSVILIGPKTLPARTSMHGHDLPHVKASQ